MSSADSVAVSAVTTTEPSSSPDAVLAGTTLVKVPRRFRGAYSNRNAEAPAYSPAAEKPCTSRTTSSRIGASTPTCAYPGSRAITKVAADMMRMDSDNAVRLPTRSPKCPQKIPPIGRMTNDTANTAKVDSSPAVADDSGKNTTAIVVAR